MALESVFAKALPKVGLANKDTQNGEMESADSHPDDEVCAADLEEGEIVDSGHEDSDDPQTGGGGGPSGQPSGGAAPLVRGPPLPPQEALRPPFTKLEKRKRKKRKKDDQGGGPDAKQKRAHYVDHDRMADDTVWFPPESGGGLLHGPPMHHPPRQGGGGGGPMSARGFGSPHPYDDSYMPSPQRGCDSPDGAECLEGLQECMVGPPHRGGGGGGGAFPGRGGGRGGRGKPPFMGDMRRPGPPPKKKKKKNKLSARGGGNSGKRDGPPKRSVCKFYLDSKCNKGADCPFSHDAPQTRKADLCKFYLGGYCARGEHCSFMHQDFPCKFFHTGAKCYADASCRFSHQPLTDETRRLLHRYLDNCGGRMDDDMLPPGGGGPDCLDFPPERRPGGPDDDRAGGPPGEDFGGPPPCAKRPSLLGSPPRHVKEAAETWRMQFLSGGGGGPLRGPAPPFGPQGPSVMSPPRGFPTRPSFYMETMSMSPVRGPLPPPGASPPQRGGPCLDEGFAAPLGGASAMGGGVPLPHGRPGGGFGSPAGISSPPLQDQGICGPGGIAPNPGMSPRGVFFDPSQDQPMSPPSQQQQPQCIPGLNLAGPLSPPHNQAAAPAAAQIPSTDASSDQPHRSPSHRSPPQPTHHDDQDGGSSDDSHSALLNEKKVLPPNLPRRQRELFMRIQQQQRTAETTAAAEAADAAPNSGASPAAAAVDQAEGPAAAKPEPAKIASLLVGNDESSSDDDEDYDPLTAVLKKLQQAPVDSRNSSSASVAASGASTVAAPSPAQPSPLAVPSMAGLDIARMLNNLRQVPSEPQTNFWKQLFSGVSAATAAVAATSAAETMPAPCPPPPAVSRDPRRARAEAQLAKQTEQPPTSRDPRLRDKPPPAPKVLETAFVESKDGDVPYKLTLILRALPNYDDVVRGGAIPESKLKSDPRLAKYVGQKLPEPVAAAPAILATPPAEAALKLAAALPLPAVSALLKPPTVVNRRDPRMARHLEQAPQQQPPPTESKPLIAELPKLTPPPLPAEVVPKADPRKAAALAANGGTGTQRVDPRLARRLEQQKAAAASPNPSEPPPPPPPPPPPRLAEETATKADEEQAKPKPTAKRDPRQRGRGQPGKPRGNADGRKNRMDYASPLSTYESEGDRPSGYSSYQRRPQPRPPVLPADAMPPPPPPPPKPAPQPLLPAAAAPSLISDDLLFQADQAMKSLKDVFKTKDPTASPFC